MPSESFRDRKRTVTVATVTTTVTAVVLAQESGTVL